MQIHILSFEGHGAYSRAGGLAKKKRPPFEGFEGEQQCGSGNESRLTWNIGSALRTDKDGEMADIEVQAATAILLLEAAHGDEAYVWREHRAILRGLERGFGIGRAEALRLLGRAEEIRPPVVKLADVTEVIVDRYSKEQRSNIVTLLWRVIDADDLVDEWEEIFADHIARAVGLRREEAELARRRADA